MVAAKPTGTEIKFRLSQVAVCLPDFHIQLQTTGQLTDGELSDMEDEAANAEGIDTMDNDDEWNDEHLDDEI